MIAELVALGRRCLVRVIEVEFVDRSVALASLAFTSMIPLGVVVSSVLPGVDGDGFADALVRRFELDASTAELVRSVFSPPSDVRQTVSVAGLVLLVGSALSFTRGFQRVYERAWRLPSLGVRATPAGLLWLVGIVAFVVIFGGIRSSLIDGGGPVAAVVVGLAFAAVVWLASPFVLLSRRVAWRDLLPTAALTSVGMTVLSIGAILYMPRSIAESAERYGPIGVAIALLSYLVAAAFVLVVCAAVGAVVGQREAREPA